MSIQAALVRSILEKFASYEWTLQGFGMFRTKIANVGRIHVWDSRAATPQVSTMHSHPWPLSSTIISGELINQRFEVNEHGPLFYMRSQIKCGEGGGLSGDAELVRLLPHVPEFYMAGHQYTQRADEIHRSIPQDGTVTLMERPQGMDSAYVLWPAGTFWVSAEPKRPEHWRVESAITLALARWDDGSVRQSEKHSDACKIRNLARPSSCDSECAVPNSQGEPK